VEIAGAAKIEKGGDTGCAYGDVGQTETPRAAERVADDDGNALVGTPAESGGEAACGAIWMAWKKRDHIVAGNVGMIDASVGADESVVSLDDQNGVAADDAARFAQNDLDQTWIFLESGGELGGSRRRLNGRKLNEATFGFRDDLLSDYEDVGVLERYFRVTRGFDDQADEIVAFADLRQPRQR